MHGRTSERCAKCRSGGKTHLQASDKTCIETNKSGYRSNSQISQRRPRGRHVRSNVAAIRRTASAGRRGESDAQFRKAGFRVENSRTGRTNRKLETPKN